MYKYKKEELGKLNKRLNTLNNPDYSKRLI